MTPINNSDTAWLITTDYLQDNNLPYIELKQDIISPDVNQWHYEEDHHFLAGSNVGGIYEYVGFMEIIPTPTVGGNITRIIRSMNTPVSLYVGGHKQ